jgi:ubiquinol oxidase
MFYAEAENERMHLMTFMTLKQPGVMFRTMILGAQGYVFECFF